MGSFTRGGCYEMVFSSPGNCFSLSSLILDSYWKWKVLAGKIRRRSSINLELSSTKSCDFSQKLLDLAHSCGNSHKLSTNSWSLPLGHPVLPPKLPVVHIRVRIGTNYQGLRHFGERNAQGLTALELNLIVHPKRTDEYTKIGFPSPF